MRDPSTRLAWVQRNRRRRERVVPVGQAVAASAASWFRGTERAPEWIREVVERIGGEAFARWCRVCSLDRGVVTVEVSEASLIAWATRTWRGPMLAAIREMPSGRGVRDVIFAYRRTM